MIEYPSLRRARLIARCMLTWEPRSVPASPDLKRRATQSYGVIRGSIFFKVGVPTTVFKNPCRSDTNLRPNPLDGPHHVVKGRKA
jgi:hypothetical protein